MASSLATGFPNAPFIAPNGDISVVWRNFLLALFTRTGGAVGAASDATLGPALNAETAARIAADNAIEASLATETTARSSGDAGLRASLDAEALARAHADATIMSNQNTFVTGNFASEQAARILGDMVLANDIAAIRVLALLVNGDVPVGIICNPDGTPIYVEELPP